MLKAARDGETAISRAMTRRRIRRLQAGLKHASAVRPIKSALTAREWAIVHLPKPDHSADHAADTLVLSPETVRSHLKNLTRN